MKLLLDAFWRAAAYCLHPRVILLSLLPLLLAAGLSVGLGYLYWEAAVSAVRDALDQWDLVATFLSWLESAGAAGLRSVLAPLIVVALAVPLIVVLSMLMVAVLMTPPIVNLVAARRFADLARLHGAGWFHSLAWSIGNALVALLVLAASIPLWLVPPLVLVLPPLIWGWLTYRVMAFDVLSDHASPAERRALFRAHRWPLLAIGVLSGYLGAAPSLLWAASAMLVIFAPLLVAAAVWLYTLVFAFATLWFAHYALAALQQMRRDEAALAAAAPPAPLVLEATGASEAAPPTYSLPPPA